MRGRASNRTDLPLGLLVRPDGIVAWATSGEDIAGLDSALRQWCGDVPRHPRVVKEELSANCREGLEAGAQ